jgi:hypothetical protein
VAVIIYCWSRLRVVVCGVIIFCWRFSAKGHE